MSETLTIDERFSGPPGSGNGGYVSGRLASRLEGPAEVTLRRPVPLGRSLAVIDDENGSELRDGETLLARAERWEPDLVPPPPVDLDTARAASARFPRQIDHPLPRCFVCGTGREPGDGLRIFPGRLDGSWTVAAPWIPDPSLGDPDGFVREEFLWAALDCTGAFAVNEPARGLVLLGRLAAHVSGRHRAEDPAVILGWPLADQGRKLLAGTALFDARGTLLAAARATWIFVEGPTGPAPWREPN